MKLSPGICGLCSVNDKVIISLGTKKISSFLPQTLKSVLGGNRNLNEISGTLKICPICLAHMLKVVQYEENVQPFSTLNHRCSICRNVEHLITVNEWAQFDNMLEIVNANRGKQCTVCLPCIAYLERLNAIKGYFLKQYRHLQGSSSSKGNTKTQRNNRKKLLSYSKEPDSQDLPRNGLDVKPNSKEKRKSAKNGLGKDLKHLRPLKYSGLKMEQYQSDTRLLEQVAFVKIQTTGRSPKIGKSKSKSPSKCSPKKGIAMFSPLSGPSFKIKLIAKNPKKASASKKQVTPKSRKSKSRQNGKTQQQTPKTKTLIVKILRENLNELKLTLARTTYEANTSVEPTTPSTDGSDEINSKNLLPSSKKKKHVSFREELIISDEGTSSEILPSDAKRLETGMKRNRLFISDAESETCNLKSETDQSDAVSEKKRKIDLIDEMEAVDVFDELKAADNECTKSTDDENTTVLEHPLEINEKENEENPKRVDDVETEPIASPQRSDKESEETNTASINGNKSEFTVDEQLEELFRETPRYSLASELQQSGPKSDTSSEGTSVTLAEFKKSRNSLQPDTEVESTLENPMDFIRNEDSLSGQEELPEKNEEPVEQETLNAKDAETVEVENCEEASTVLVEAPAEDVLIEAENDDSPDSLRLHLDFEPTKDEYSTCTPTSEGSDVLY